VGWLPLCYTLEDEVRPEGVKVYGKTAIPAGRYEIRVTWSDRFQKPMPEVVGVPGFTGIRIHPGNTAANTEGCILVGREKDSNNLAIYKSRDAFRVVFDMIAATLQKESLWLTITNDFAGTTTQERRIA
jgi:hypothetical protein